MSKTDVKEWVNLQIKSHKVVVFSKTYCPFCTMVKTALKDVGLEDYLLVELDSLDNGAEIMDVLGSITGARTVPRVFVGGKFIGGGTDIRDLKNSGQLVPILKEAGAL